VLAQLQRGHRGKGVCVFTGADDNGIKQFVVIVHLAEVNKLLGGGMPLAGEPQMVFVNVTQRYDILRFDRPQIRAAAASASNDRDVQPLVKISGS
jgi:hypothetical protein